MRAPNWPDINHAFADAYSTCAHAGAEMRRATEAIESIRDAFNAKKDQHTILATFDEQIGRAELVHLAPTLATLRDLYESSIVTGAVEQLNEVFSTDPSAGWKLWLEAYSSSFDDRRWSRRIAAEITARALQFSPIAEWPVAKIQRQIQKALRGSWAETYEWFLFLGRQDLSARDRATFLCIAAEVQIYHFLRPTRAKEILEECNSLAADYHVVIRCWGEYWILLGKFEEARKCFERVVRERPDLADGFIGIAECCDNMKDIATAETYYNQAVSNAPGMSDGYSKLMNWHGRPEWFENREALIEPLFRRELALTDYKPAALADIGCLLRQNRRFEQARQRFEEAIKLDPDYSLGYTWLGYVWLDEAMAAGLDTPTAGELLDKARASFLKTIELDSDSLNGYWAMSTMEMSRAQWESALDWCQRAFECHPEWEPFLKVRRAEIFRQLGRLDDAQQDLESVLEMEPNHPPAADVLSDLASSFENNNNYDSAIAALEKWRSLKGESIEYLFQNRVGNIFYRASNYAAAAERYRLAIAAAPTDDVLHSNLALALENLHLPGARLQELDDAVKALNTAIALAPAKPEYAERLANLETERKFIQVYGEDAMQIEPGVTAIRVEVRSFLFSDLLNESFNNLSSDTLAKTEAMRTRIRDRYGITIPVVNFGELTYSIEWSYKITIQEQYEYGGDVEPGARFAPDEGNARSDATPPAGKWFSFSEQLPEHQETWSVVDYVLRHTQKVVELHLAGFLGHQEAFYLLNGSGVDPAKAILKRPEELTRAVQVLKSLLRMKVPIKSIDIIANEFMRLRESGTELNSIPVELAKILASEPAAHTEQTPAYNEQ
jgi:tetratricopeptide (TPR) repeat protein